MRTFVWEGVEYEFDANACYDRGGLVALPDDRVLRVGCWLECLPPKPSGFRLHAGPVGEGIVLTLSRHVPAGPP